MHSFIFELGIEELPDSVLLPALSSLEASFKKVMGESDLGYSEIKLGCTPRRLALYASGLPLSGADQNVEKIGPAISIAYTSDGALSPAGKGFLKKIGANEEDAFIQENEKGKFLAVKFTQKGKLTQDILQKWITDAIMQIPLPKKMIWNNRELGFSRPIRWLLSLWDAEIIPVNFYGIESGRISYGNRWMGLNIKAEVQHADGYFKALETVGVIANRDSRKEQTRAQMKQLFAPDTYTVADDERLLDTVINLVEYPTAVVAEFEERFLTLPEKIITSTISQNQKYFSVFGADGKLSNKFVFISNGDPTASATIRKGNEKVVKARLEDAMWFYSEDCKRSLDSYLPLLDDVVFQSQLGSLAEKTTRVKALANFLAKALNVGTDIHAKLLRTATLSKADLVTLMLGEKEFTKLQGYMGKQYALAAGEDAEVAEGIYEHYMPRGSNDSLPSTLCGAVCAVADKLDTVAGIIGVGLLPTGSADPFALRRAAGGLVQIVAARNWDIDIIAMIDKSLDLLKEKVSDFATAEKSVKSFVQQRIVWLLKEIGISHDVVAAVIHNGVNRLDVLQARALALQSVKQKDDFLRLVIGFKRVSNIIKDIKDFGTVNPELFELAAESELFEALNLLSGRIDIALNAMGYLDALQILIDFGGFIDRFFDAVLVNCDDLKIRDNRYALLYAIRNEFLRVADISLIVIENEEIGV